MTMMNKDQEWPDTEKNWLSEDTKLHVFFLPISFLKSSKMVDKTVIVKDTCIWLLLSFPSDHYT